MTTPEQAAYLAHSPLRAVIPALCDNWEHTCKPETCKLECLTDAARDWLRFIEGEGNGDDRS